jgi:hypothetical protein
MDEENEKPETNEQRLNREATEYWARVSAKGGGGSDEPEQKRRQPRETEMAKPPPPPSSIDPEETDPAILIIDALRKSTDANQAALAEARATRQDIAESDRQTKRLADTAADNIRMLNTTIQNFAASQSDLERAKSHNFYWGVGGFILGIVVLEAGTIAWQHMFG